MKRALNCSSLFLLALLLTCGQAQRTANETGSNPKATAPAREATIIKLHDIPVTELVPNTTTQLFHSDSMMVSWLNMRSNAQFPLTFHESEEILMVLNGNVHFVFGNKMADLTPGDIVILPSNITHSATAGPEGCTLISIFHPIRIDYLKKMEEQRKDK
jgi:quercetin dioxygenase-like cupin family protein